MDLFKIYSIYVLNNALFLTKKTNEYCIIDEISISDETFTSSQFNDKVLNSKDYNVNDILPVLYSKNNLSKEIYCQGKTIIPIIECAKLVLNELKTKGIISDDVFCSWTILTNDSCFSKDENNDMFFHFIFKNNTVEFYQCIGDRKYYYHDFTTSNVLNFLDKIKFDRFDLIPMGYAIENE